MPEYNNTINEAVEERYKVGMDWDAELRIWAIERKFGKRTHPERFLHDAETELHTDASHKGIAGMFLQRQGGELVVNELFDEKESGKNYFQELYRRNKKLKNIRENLMNLDI